MADARTSVAIDLMTRFAHRTGITSREPSRRYLWTDAFAVCNFLGLEVVTSDPSYRVDALRLIEQVHGQLGRYREDSGCAGWISGLDEEEGAMHPTRGGLRIGKPFPERGPTEPLDPEAEWDRDGQYFHYLTKWAHALDRATCATKDANFHVWARELMDTAHRAFSYGPATGRQMAWKLSTDLSRPLVLSMGQHDPLDGFVTCAELDATAMRFKLPSNLSLASAKTDFAQMIDLGRLPTADPLGIGGLLFDACRLVAMEPEGEGLVTRLLAAALVGLQHYLSSSDLRAPANRRLAFRELGLAIGLAGVSMLQTDIWMDRIDARGRQCAELLARYAPLRDEIESFWTSPASQRSAMWSEHRDINEVMLATSLLPDGFLAQSSTQGANQASFAFHP